MNTKQFSILVAILVLGITILAFAQTYGSISYGAIAPTLAQCNAGMTNTTTFCTVGSGSSFVIYVSFNGGTYQPLVPATSAGVTSFNGRSGAVTLTKGDVTATGLAASSSTTASTTTTLQ